MLASLSRQQSLILYFALLLRMGGLPLELSKKLITELNESIASTSAAHFQSEITKENNKLRDEKRQLEHELKKYLDRQSNNFTPRSHNSIRAISIPMGGSPKQRIKPKRR